ncbi:CsbD family protein [Embleya sp. NBC_00896]|uniref:CsbD family protein n=1 Tax=Embleya sp. NBC_00896 TaxID=2975961 RepID=UPI00387071E5|nr:CsbD family protein [Embleya sp. NBC_00896]
MGTDDNIRNKAEKATGRAKEKVGDVTGDEDLRAEGQEQQGAAKAREVADEAKDKATEAINKIKGASKRD